MPVTSDSSAAPTSTGAPQRHDASPGRDGRAAATRLGTGADLMVIFGITGDLARKMAFRALYRLERRGLLHCPIIGVAHEELSTDQVRERARAVISAAEDGLDELVFDRLAARHRLCCGQPRAVVSNSFHRSRTSHPAVVEQYDAGAPPWSPFALAGVARGGQPARVRGASRRRPPRERGRATAALPIARQQAIWSWLRAAARFTTGNAAVGVELVWPSHGSTSAHRARHGRPIVTVTGDPLELALVAFGRQRVARVDYDGEPTRATALVGAKIAV